ncbi:MAG TPA: hypothetical protein DCM38_13535 [Gammaproteobacteria bacterium]|nr:Gp49 family protein [Candidatus Parabeggiatoa sp.]HAI70444.1 hypothetical protein [Gammaproteobacteria bacterium]
MKSEIAKTEYFRLGHMTMLCLLTLENGYEILGSATKRITNDRDEEEARGIAYQRAVYQQIELESLPQTRTVGVIATNLV